WGEPENLAPVVALFGAVPGNKGKVHAGSGRTTARRRKQCHEPGNPPGVAAAAVGPVRRRAVRPPARPAGRVARRGPRVPAALPGIRGHPRPPAGPPSAEGGRGTSSGRARTGLASVPVCSRGCGDVGGLAPGTALLVAPAAGRGWPGRQ